MILGNRIKKLRKELDLTQQELGKRIGIKPNSISLIESGNRNASEQVILSICREFNVSENWLRTGEGEMFIQRSEDDELKQAVEAMLRGRNPNFKRRLISVLASLDESDWIVLEKKILELAEAARTEMDIAAEVASYEEELRLQAQAVEKSSVSGGQSGIGKAKMA